ncbi:MAG: enoyl-CoA hydratase/isomerase family protein [Cytophagaceae bacterium]
MSIVKYEVKDRKAIISINRPDKRNALNAEVVSELKKLLSKAEKDPEVKIVILTGEGEAFCAGADLQYLQQLQKNSYEENLQDSTELKELFFQIHKLSKVVIAKVNGHAIAGGCGLVSVCDFAISAASANFGYTEVRIGFIPAIVMVFLVRKLGEAKAKELLLSGNIYHSAEAKEIGLITKVVEDNELDKAVDTFAERLITYNSSNSMALTKQMISDVQDMKLEDALNYAAMMNAKARASEDCKKGIDAFLNKTKPEW